MATTSLQSIRQSFVHRHRRHSFAFVYNPEPKLAFLFQPGKSGTKYVLFSNLSSSNSLTTTPTPVSGNVKEKEPSTVPSLELLEHHLSCEDYRQADEVTRHLLIVLAGEAAQKRGYVFFTEVQFISTDDLRAIDQLWRRYSQGKFGYSVQKRLWEKSRRDFTRFFIRLGWMKKLDTEVEQYNYRAFPDEFVWELKDDTPEGHLPLTNALRGTQLFMSILTHPAFVEAEEGSESDSEAREEKSSESVPTGGAEKTNERKKLLDFKPDYSF